MGNFVEVAKSRRSAMKFHTGIEIPKSELEEILNLVKYAPSAFNLQHAHYLIVEDPDVKMSVYEAAYKQYKVQTASAAILVLGDLKAYQQVAEINEGLLNLGVMSKQEYDQEVESVTSFYEIRGETFQREEAIRNASLSAMLFMLAAKDKGWDTCPMIGFDAEQMKKALHIPDRYVPAMLITMGKENTASQRPRGYRKPVAEFVTFNKF